MSLLMFLSSQHGRTISGSFNYKPCLIETSHISGAQTVLNLSIPCVLWGLWNLSKLKNPDRCIPFPYFWCTIMSVESFHGTSLYMGHELGLWHSVSVAIPFSHSPHSVCYSLRPTKKKWHHITLWEKLYIFTCTKMAITPYHFKVNGTGEWGWK